MRLHIKLDENTVADIARRAPVACAYWANDTSIEETLPPTAAALRKVLRKRLTVGTALLRTISADDVWSVDTLVQLALFGELRFG